jgi:hypothetical protein
MYCTYENGFMKFIIENDVGIICLKMCVFFFKSLGDVSLITLDVSIAQCSF